MIRLELGPISISLSFCFRSRVGNEKHTHKKYTVDIHRSKNKQMSLTGEALS